MFYVSMAAGGTKFNTGTVFRRKTESKKDHKDDRLFVSGIQWQEISLLLRCAKLCFKLAHLGDEQPNNQILHCFLFFYGVIGTLSRPIKTGV